jgi:hypothetical protein
MSKENVVYMNNGVLFSHKIEWNYVIYMKRNRTGDYHIKQNKPDWEKQILHVFSDMFNLD